jgi:REP element-mobilizing transposase RayT
MGRRGRKSLTDETVYFVTTTVVNFAKVFTDDIYCNLLIHNIKHYQQRYSFTIHGYVIMPTHFHWLVTVDPSKGTLSDIMRDIKKYSAWDIMNELENQGKENLCRLFSAMGSKAKNQKRKFWMERFDDEAIRNYRMFLTKLEYIHYNPIKAGLVSYPEDFKYSSARNYLLGDHSVLYVDTNSL